MAPMMVNFLAMLAACFASRYCPFIHKLSTAVDLITAMIPSGKQHRVVTKTAHTYTSLP